MSVAELDEMGPIDYVLIEWRDQQPRGEAAPLLMDLADRGIIRILDLAFLVKDAAGSVTVLEAADVSAVEALEELAGAASGLLGDDDLEEAATALEAGTSALLLIFENSWAGPLASTVRHSGGELVASGRIPIQAVLEAIETAEAGR